MTYNKSEIMKKAWNKYRLNETETFSEALKLSWKEAKNAKRIKEINSKLFDFDMIDRQSQEEKELIMQLRYKRTELIEASKKAEKKEVKTIVNPRLGFLEAFRLRKQMEEINSSANPDWDKYNELESKLYVAA